MKIPIYTFFATCLIGVGTAGLSAATRPPKSCPTTFNPGSFTSGDFFTNFNNNCYLISFSTGNGAGGQEGDLNSIYNKIYFKANSTIPPYQLIIVGQFPNARYFSVALYDNHSAIIQNLTDVNIVPLTSKQINPYQPGVAFMDGQQYAVPINLGGTPGTLEPGCVMTGYNVNQNAMDGTLRHQFMNWNLDAAYYAADPTAPPHEVDSPTHSHPNTAGAVLVRSYLTLTAASSSSVPHIIVRDVATGCAYPASMINSLNILTSNASVGNTWLNQGQVTQHNIYAGWQPTGCWATIPTSQSQLQWIRGDEYVSGANPDSAYLYTYVPDGLPATLAAANEVMRFRFHAAATPPTPCTNGCSRTGNEQLRYMSISFQVPGGATLASLADSCPQNPVYPCTPLVTNADGYVTLVVGTGVPQPAWVTPANGYTWLDLSQYANYQTLNEIAIRNILPSASFNCGGNMLPYKVGEATGIKGAPPFKGEATGLMGLFAPAVDYPVASQTSLPPVAGDLAGPYTCAVFPYGPPAVSPTCQTMLPNSPMITQVSTQCAALGCNTFFVQPQPPVNIISSVGGFGYFPFGLPYTGNPGLLRITDYTQGWSAGYAGDPCTLQIGEWSDNSISVVANVNQNGKCPMAAGDQLSVTVTNPQTTVTAAAAVTAYAPPK